jgi:hypothetical protein
MTLVVGRLDLNQEPTDYEPDALTNGATGPSKLPIITILLPCYLSKLLSVKPFPIYRCQVWPLSAVIQTSPALVTILPCCALENSMLVMSPVSVAPDAAGSTRVQ